MRKIGKVGTKVAGTIASTIASALLCALLVGAACGANPTPGQDPGDVGLVELALDLVPDGVVCLRVSATGPYRNKIALLPVVPGITFTQTMTGLPLGSVAFAGEAFTKVCGDVTTKSVPEWVTDTVAVSIVDGTKGQVALHMQRNGRADVVVDFSDEPACSAAGVACKSKTECCSDLCTGGACAVPAMPDAMP